VGQEGAVSDYVVVGAGSAGSVVVRRLLDAGHSVHLIEAGPVDTSPAIHSPQGWPALLGGPLDWGGVHHTAAARERSQVVLAARKGAGWQQFVERNDLYPRPRE